MTTIRATVHDRRIEIPAPKELPDGTEVVLELSAVVSKIGLTESEWRDDEQAINDWTAWIQTIKPVQFDNQSAFEDEFRCFNIEAVKAMMSGDRN